MKKLILILVGLTITLCSFAQPTFYRAYSRAFGEVTPDDNIKWEELENCHTLFSVEEDRLVVYANETTTIYITGNLTEDADKALIYEGVDSDGGDCTLYISKTEEGNSFMIIRYTYAAVMFWFNKEK